MRGISERVFMGAGRPDPTGQAYFLNANAAADLPAELSVSKQIHSAGSGRTGFPDLYVDGTDTVHFSYGALETVFYNKYTAAGSRVFSSDIAVFDGLGSWHLSCGLSAIAASDDGDSVLAIGLLSDGSDGAIRRTRDATPTPVKVDHDRASSPWARSSSSSTTTPPTPASAWGRSRCREGRSPSGRAGRKWPFAAKPAQNPHNFRGKSLRLAQSRTHSVFGLQSLSLIVAVEEPFGVQNPVQSPKATSIS